MSQQDSVDRGYQLADEWISTILATNPELLIDKLAANDYSGDGKAPTPNTAGAINLAKTLAAFRLQLAVELLSQHHPKYPELDD